MDTVVIKHPNLHLGKEGHLFQPDGACNWPDLVATEPKFLLKLLLDWLAKLYVFIVFDTGDADYITQQFFEIDVTFAN